MKTQIKRWGDSNVVVLSADFMKFHKAQVGDWVDLDGCMVLSKEDAYQKNIQFLKDRFPSAYEFHIKQNPQDKIE